MILALASMSPTVQAIFYGLAFVAFVIVVVVHVVRTSALDDIAFIALGLALFVFVAFWNALAAT